MSPAAGAAKPAKVTSASSANAAVLTWEVAAEDTPLDAPVPAVGTREPFWGARDGPRIPRWSVHRFFPGPPPAPGIPAAVRFATSPLLLGGVFAVLGSFAVFVQQASIELQIVIGAPVFEELVKVGLALLLVGAVPRGGRLFPLVALLRIGVAWSVGAGFGWLEHVVTYAGEPQEIFLGRVLFHGGSTALSMAAYCVLEGAADVRLRWFATAPATALHYANNVGAIAFIAAPDRGLAWAAAITAAVYVLLVAGPLSARAWRPWAAAWTLRHWPFHPSPTPEDWDDARATAAAAGTASGSRPAQASPGPR
ncbi:MAG TPA: hypothetical protein VM327_00555 [Candidatus Thermoplasmatota archaeon]|nr:hypothetical protein [Candidatus Thermoplasmatota archaeon]